MKKLIALILALGIAVVAVGCSNVTVMDESDIHGKEERFSMFVEVERCLTWKIVYDSETKVMYAVSYGGHSYGAFTLLVNPDGSPKLWEGK